MPIEKITPTPYHPDDEPLVCVRLNAFWIPYLLGALRPLRFQDYWQGTTDQITQAQRDYHTLVYQLETLLECGDDPMAVNYCCIERVIERRINPITLLIEISIDGGETWTPDPASVTTQLIAQPPPVTSGVYADKCDAASNGWYHILDMIAAAHTNLESAQTVGEFAVAVAEAIIGIILFIGSAGALAPYIIAFSTAIFAALTGVFNMGIEAFDAYWTQDEKDKIFCHLYCNLGTNGAFTQAGYDTFLQEWKADATPSLAFNFVYTSVQAVSLKGMNNMCAYGSAPLGACEDCACDECGANWDIWTAGTITDIGVHPPGTFIINGQVNVSNAQYFDVQATAQQNPPPNYAITMKSSAPSECCSVYYETLEGSAVNFAIINCGDAQDPANWNFSALQGSPACGLELAGTDAFKVRITLLGL